MIVAILRQATEDDPFQVGRNSRLPLRRRLDGLLACASKTFTGLSASNGGWPVSR